VTTPRAGSVEKATRAELRRLRFSVQSDASAALAVSLARHIDTTRGAVAAAAAAAQLRLLLTDLRAAAADRPVRNRISDIRGDELAARRAAG
jgi:hypothetical protein